LGLGQSTVENLVTDQAAAWKGRSVLVTGHTGFKGGWLTLWLHKLGATVHGYALEPPTNPNLFDVADVRSILASDIRADLADLSCLKLALRTAQPEVVFHLAGQPIVRESYRDPVGTLTTNVLGTTHVLEATRSSESVRALVIITTDKVYENRESSHAYSENDPLGGQDPYSASKAAAEIVTASYRASFFSGDEKHGARIASARAGNVIGGGDWAADRLVPDCLRAFARGESVGLRFPDAMRPWQHVLEPLSGYLHLAGRLLGKGGDRFATAWNFGPDESGDATVIEVAQTAARLWGNEAQVEEMQAAGNPHEAGLLRLDSSRARNILGWTPRWSLSVALEKTVSWHRAWMERGDMTQASLDQIASYESTEKS
jgi:CDP-glucose 4,6-dehydratase